MKLFGVVYLLSSLIKACRGQTATISLGSPQQYTSIPNASLVLNGTTIAYSADDQSDGGIDISLSDDIRDKLQAVGETTCRTDTDQCYQATQDVLLNPETEIQARSLILLSAGVFLVCAVIMTYLYTQPEPIPAVVRVPSELVSQAPAVETASVLVASLDSTLAHTYTKKPPQTEVVGTVAPTFTSIASTGNGYTAGDVLLCLSNALARQLDDFVRRSTECDAARQFGTSRSRKRSADFGAMLCSAEAIIINSVPGGPFSDLRLIDAPQLPFTVSDAIRAMRAAMDFAHSYAPALLLDPTIAENLGVAAFAIAWEVLANGQTLVATNVIPAQDLAGTITAAPSMTPSETSTAACTACAAGCQFFGPILYCSTDCSSASSCTTGTGQQLSTTATIAYTVYGNVSSSSAVPSATVTPILSIPPPEPTLGSQNCNGFDSYGASHPDIHEDTMVKWIRDIICKEDESFSSSSPPLDWNPRKANGNKDNYHYRISWIAGCATTEDTQHKQTPIKTDSSVTCGMLLYNNYKNCINGGVGGWIDAGCLRYEFNPSTA